MPFGRRRWQKRRKSRDPFEHLADERQAAEAEAWFMQPDDGPELEIEAGISSNLRDEDLDPR